MGFHWKPILNSNLDLAKKKADAVCNCPIAFLGEFHLMANGWACGLLSRLNTMVDERPDHPCDLNDPQTEFERGYVNGWNLLYPAYTEESTPPFV